MTRFECTDCDMETQWEYEISMHEKDTGHRAIEVVEG